MNPWSHLPNAQLIDWMLASLKFNPDIWGGAWETARASTSVEAWKTAWNASWDATYDAARDVARDAAQNAAWEAARDAACCDAAFAAARDAILALIAYDDSDQYLNMTYEQLSVYAVLSDKSQALLLLPLKLVQKNEQNKRMVTSV